jgi:hypothetical protein
MMSLFRRAAAAAAPPEMALIQTYIGGFKNPAILASAGAGMARK